MFEPFIWMFKAEDFRQRYLQLLVSIIVFLSISVILYLLGKNIFEDFYFSKISLLLSVLLPLVLIFLIQGYFWELTANVIARDMDIVASNIYSGKIKQIFIVKIPEFKPFVFIWRGFASFIASILMFIPFVLLVISTQYTSIFFEPYENIDLYHKLYALSYNIIYFLFFALVPAFLWNYAKQNSVVAVWDLRKAIYIFETYPFKYIWNTFVFIVFYIFNYVILYGIQKYLFHFEALKVIDFNIVNISAFAFILIAYLIYLYSLHVYAYLLGTITPISEG